MALRPRSCCQHSGPVFGREGYARASVDALAAAAGVSTRTLYNHFPGGKALLFQAVVERDLVSLARGLIRLLADYAYHFALVRHIHAEADHVPPEVVTAWHEAGPAPVGRALTEALARLEEAGLLDLHGDAALAAGHFMALISHTIVQFTHYGVLPLPATEQDRLITGGVSAFLRAYRAG
ncbi:TetR/AcrR family transcriptional regulator C-terminal domain-containing protein [Streptomyces achromogenes]|uniref:TetR/AcrR family transcriptional regulator C-terminal domain-containing protein n=1 Tax=Streptomyces achromogenes TaxID=67255 RepID=UPI003A808994